MKYTKDLLDRQCVKCGADEGVSPIPQEGTFYEQVADYRNFRIQPWRRDLRVKAGSL